MQSEYQGSTTKTTMASCLALSSLLFLASSALADSVYRCRMNAQASRDFAYSGEKPSWCGGLLACDGEASFKTKLFPQPNFDDLSYRELLISIPEKSDLVTVKSYWAKGDDGKPLSEEFRAIIISRDSPVVFFMYQNPTRNKIHSYALNVKHKQLVAALVMNGLTSLGAEARTYDCE